MSAPAFPLPQLHRRAYLTLEDIKLHKEKVLKLKEAEFFADVYRLVAADKPRKALTKIYDYLDDLVLCEQLTLVDAALQAVDLGKLNPACMLGFLTITLATRDRLTEWEPLLARARRECLERGLTDEKVERLFGALR